MHLDICRTELVRGGKIKTYAKVWTSQKSVMPKSPTDMSNISIRAVQCTVDPICVCALLNLGQLVGGPVVMKTYGRRLQGFSFFWTPQDLWSVRFQK